jgi:hypothetical protein
VLLLLVLLILLLVLLLLLVILVLGRSGSGGSLLARTSGIATLARQVGALLVGVEARDGLGLRLLRGGTSGGSGLGRGLRDGSA